MDRGGGRPRPGDGRAEFHDPDNGGFFYVGTSHEPLIARQKDAHDNATPSGNAMAATALVPTRRPDRPSPSSPPSPARPRAIQPVLERVPTAAGQSLVALDFLLAPTAEFALIAGNDPEEAQLALREIHSKFRPNKVIAPAFGPVPPELAKLVPPPRRPPGEGRPGHPLRVRELRLPGPRRRPRADPQGVGGELMRPWRGVSIVGMMRLVLAVALVFAAYRYRAAWPALVPAGVATLLGRMIFRRRAGWGRAIRVAGFVVAVLALPLVGRGGLVVPVLGLSVR